MRWRDMTPRLRCVRTIINATAIGSAVTAWRQARPRTLFSVIRNGSRHIARGIAIISKITNDADTVKCSTGSTSLHNGNERGRKSPLIL